MKTSQKEVKMFKNTSISSETSIRGPRQRRAVEALLTRESIPVSQIGKYIGGNNPRQTIMELRRQGFENIILTRRNKLLDRDGKICWPGEYLIPEEMKPAVRESLNKHVVLGCNAKKGVHNQNSQKGRGACKKK